MSINAEFIVILLVAVGLIWWLPRFTRQYRHERRMRKQGWLSKREFERHTEVLLRRGASGRRH